MLSFTNKYFTNLTNKYFTNFTYKYFTKFTKTSLSLPVITTKTMDETTSVSKLVIESAEAEDEGMYVCLATNVAGSNIENAALTVNGQLEFRVSTMLNNFES